MFSNAKTTLVFTVALTALFLLSAGCLGLGQQAAPTAPSPTALVTPTNTPASAPTSTSTPTGSSGDSIEDAIEKALA